MPWYSDTDALAVAKELFHRIKSLRVTKKGNHVACHDEYEAFLIGMAKLLRILEMDSLTCTCWDRSRGVCANFLMDD